MQARGRVEATAKLTRAAKMQEQYLAIYIVLFETLMINGPTKPTGTNQCAYFSFALSSASRPAPSRMDGNSIQGKWNSMFEALSDLIKITLFSLSGPQTLMRRKCAFPAATSMD